MGIETILPAAASLIGSAMQSDSAASASYDQRVANEAALAEQRRQYDQTRADFAPYREVGARTLPMLESEIGRMPTAQEVMQDPGYQFGMDQGLRALANRQAAMGGRVSGQALKAAARFGTDYATSGYNAAYQRRQDRLNRLAALAGIGQTATGSSAQAGMNYANNASNLRAGLGDAMGASRMAQGNIWGNAGNQLAAIYLRNRQPGYGGGYTDINPNMGLPNYAIDPWGP